MHTLRLINRPAQDQFSHLHLTVELMDPSSFIAATSRNLQGTYVLFKVLTGFSMYQTSKQKFLILCSFTSTLNLLLGVHQKGILGTTFSRIVLIIDIINIFLLKSSTTLATIYLLKIENYLLKIHPLKNAKLLLPRPSFQFSKNIPEQNCNFKQTLEL